jgi:AbiV family abortive infection protein
MKFEEKIFYALRPSFQNAKDLFEEAELLNNSNRPTRAYTLYHFSFEETGRCFILLNLFIESALGKINPKDVNFKTLKSRGYQDHIKKLKKSTLEFSKLSTYIAILGNRPDILESVEKLYEKFDVNKMNINKNSSIYLSFKDDNFKMPTKCISQDDHLQMKNIAEINLQLFELAIQTFEKEGSYIEIIKLLKKIPTHNCFKVSKVKVAINTENPMRTGHKAL